MAINKLRWKDISFWSSFNYFRLVKSGSLLKSGNTTTTIAVPNPGTYTPYIETYVRIGSDIYPNTGQFLTTVDHYFDGTNVIITTHLSPALTIYYFIFRSNGAI